MRLPTITPTVLFLIVSSQSVTPSHPFATTIKTFSPRGGGAIISNNDNNNNNNNNHISSSGSSSQQQQQQQQHPFGTRRSSSSSSSSALRSTSTPSQDTTSTTTTPPPPISPENWSLLSPRSQTALHSLITHDSSLSTPPAQTHVYSNWPPIGTDDDKKRRLASQIADLDSSYPGGLASYLTKAKKLLDESARGDNPFDDYVASVPTGIALDYENDSKGDMNFDDAERLGLNVVGDVAFVLVAGGLGERLGYSGIKLELETNLCTNVAYLEMYVKYLQAFERMSGGRKGTIPLVIMTSDDTHEKTIRLLKDNDYFGMEESQVTLLCQDKVPALKDSNAGLSLDDDGWQIETKPHGHGDVHHLLHKSGCVERFLKEGKKYVVFLQDTNALIINSVLATLGVSEKMGFHMNSICIPRLAGEAAGAIARLEHKTDPNKSLVINVEYNQLDPLLSTQGDGLGDVPDPTTGYSPYPGNSNILVLELSSYAKTLAGEDKGVVDEFVNPKYKDEKRMEFKKPTRLECMMQDYPKLLRKELGKDANVGFTMFDRWFTFSPAKNSLPSGIDAVKSGSTAPGTMSSAESEKYIQNQRKLALAGVSLPSSSEKLVTLAGIPITPGPRIILCPGFAITRDEIKRKIISGGKITERSSLVLEGEGLIIKNLDLDGALVIRTGVGCDVLVDGLVVKNKGWELVEVGSEEEDVEEVVAIRGYRMVKHEAMEIYIDEPGRYRVGSDGVVERLD